MKYAKEIAVFATVFGCVLPALAKLPVSVTSPKEAKLGQTVNISVKTEPKAKVKIEAQDIGFSQATKLMDQTADKAGKAHWKFDIPKDFKADELPLIITVDKDKVIEKQTESIKIKK